MENTEPKKVDALTLQEQFDQLKKAYELEQEENIRLNDLLTGTQSADLLLTPRIRAMTLEEAKDKIAQIRSYENWHKMEITEHQINSGSWQFLLKATEEAAELYCLEERKRTWDEACEAQIEECKSDLNDEYHYEFKKTRI